MPWNKIVYAINTAQQYFLQNTTLGIPAMFQSEGLNEAEALGFSRVFAPVLDLSRELRWGRNPNAYPNYTDYLRIRTPTSREVLHDIETETIVLLQNNDSTLPIKKSVSSIALIRPQPEADRITFGDYVLQRVQQRYHPHSTASTSSSPAPKAPPFRTAAKSSDIAVVRVGTWSLDQTLLWTPGTNATTGEHVDLSDLGLVDAQLDLVKAVQGAGKPTMVVYVSGKLVVEPWIQDNADAAVQQFYPGERGGLAIAEAPPRSRFAAKPPLSTTPIFSNYLREPTDRSGRGHVQRDLGIWTPFARVVLGSSCAGVVSRRKVHSTHDINPNQFARAQRAAAILRRAEVSTNFPDTSLASFKNAGELSSHPSSKSSIAH
uniref:Glycoside hydrolase family 3 C-terminal domain-containing protein n=1 Tax=Mycena chlorophos TaxID=658473 RepID=A0ABQ0KW86_MYCCL|nr:predicted protein [Mycena chlorophos]